MALPGQSPPPLPEEGAGEPHTRKIRRWIWLILAVSFALRAWIAWRGGQLFWPDEDRFDVARSITRTLLNGNVRAALDALLGHPDHLLFKAASLLPASLEILLGTPGWVSALFFGLASTWVLWLVARVARAGGASETESLVAVLLAACTTSLFYYSRHYFPYDLSLGFLLLSLLAGLREPASRRTSLGAGIWACLGFLCYNGYWTLAGAALVVHVLRAFPRPGALFVRAVWAAVGLVLPVLVVGLASRLLGHDFFALAAAFAGTVNQGDLGQAHRFVPEYFWVTEHGLALLWAAGLLASVGAGAWRCHRRLLLWPGLALLVAAFLILPSDALNRFALSARHVRVLTPILCLATAAALCSLVPPRRRAVILSGLLSLVGLQAAWNFTPPLLQLFPREFNAHAVRTLTEARKQDLGPYLVANATFLHNPDWVHPSPDPGVVLVRRNHPFQFTPYLYEGYSASARARYQARDLSMRIVRLDVGGPARSGYPSGMIELGLRFPEKPFGLLPEPLLSTGSPGRGDSLFFRFEDAGHFRIGHDSMGGGATLSALLPLDRTKSHRLRINLGSFYPPDTPAAKSPTYVIWNERMVLLKPHDLHPSRPEEITIGHNFIGASTAVPQLSATIEHFRVITPPALGAVFSAHPGAMAIDLLPPGGMYSDPLLGSGQPGQGDLLYIRSAGDGLLRFGHDHAGGGSSLSEPVRYDPTQPVRLVISLGSFFFPHQSHAPGIPALRQLYLSCNDTVIFNRIALFHPSDPAQLTLGENRVASSAAPKFTGDMLRADPQPGPTVPPGLDGPPGALRLKLRFYGPITPGQTAPLLTTGRSGAGDLLFIRFDDATTYRIGRDHWGHALTLSAPQPFDPTQPLELTIALGSLFPASDDRPGLAQLRGHLFVASGGNIILNQPASFYPAAPDSLSLGVNAIGASSAEDILPADLLELEPVPAESILPRLSRP